MNDKSEVPTTPTRRTYVGVLVERMSRAVLLVKMPDTTAASALVGFTAKLQSLVAPLRQTLTYDQGRETARHTELSAATGVRVYFCDSHSPWQRGACENTNGLLRQYLRKGTDLSVRSQEQLDAIADSLNGRPRETLNWHSPLQVLAQVLANPSVVTTISRPFFEPLRPAIPRVAENLEGIARDAPPRSRWPHQTPRGRPERASVV